MALELIIKEEADFEIKEAVDYYESKKENLGIEFFIYLDDYFETLKTEIPTFELKKNLPLESFP
ncbi:hypothetical protein [Aequorivita capsosiphonis]|uniref:hypothetical protein n=1 Tax=Aequorivita capsosiphonis TaxID=487317 RepID=UPI00041246B7|nr:hypothetical protein [Aequorivita capsosiphonis]